MKKSLGAAPLAYPQVVFLVGSYDESGVPDVMNVAWGGINSGEPPCVQVNLRPERKTLANIKASGAFTVGIPSADQTVLADYFGIESANKVADKIEKAGVTWVNAKDALTAAGSDAGGVNAPVIDEFRLTLVCKAVNFLEFGSHVQVTGEIVDVLADEEILDDNGKIDMARLDPILYAHHTHEYFRVGVKAGNAFSDGLALK